MDDENQLKIGQGWPAPRAAGSRLEVIRVAHGICRHEGVVKRRAPEGHKQPAPPVTLIFFLGEILRRLPKLDVQSFPLQA